MADNNEVIKALGKVPELVEKTERVLEDSDKKFRILAEAVRQRMQAEIPSSEIEKLSSAAAAAVSRTKCASPDTGEVSRLVAEDISKSMADITRETVAATIKEVVEQNPLRMEHHHTHTTLGYMCQMAEDTLRNWLIGLAVYSILVTVAGILTGYLYFNSKMYIGGQYADEYYSKYITAEEKKMLENNIHVLSIVPDEVYTTPDLVKQKIKYNKMILSQREVEAQANKGKYSTKVPLER